MLRENKFGMREERSYIINLLTPITVRTSYIVASSHNYCCSYREWVFVSKPHDAILSLENVLNDVSPKTLPSFDREHLEDVTRCMHEPAVRRSFRIPSGFRDGEQAPVEGRSNHI